MTLCRLVIHTKFTTLLLTLGVFIGCSKEITVYQDKHLDSPTQKSSKQSQREIFNPLNSLKLHSYYTFEKFDINDKSIVKQLSEKMIQYPTFSGDHHDREMKVEILKDYAIVKFGQEVSVSNVTNKNRVLFTEGKSAAFSAKKQEDFGSCDTNEYLEKYEALSPNSVINLYSEMLSANFAPFCLLSLEFDKFESNVLFEKNKNYALYIRKSIVNSKYSNSKVIIGDFVFKDNSDSMVPDEDAAYNVFTDKRSNNPLWLKCVSIHSEASVDTLTVDTLQNVFKKQDARLIGGSGIFYEMMHMYNKSLIDFDLE